MPDIVLLGGPGEHEEPARDTGKGHAEGPEGAGRPRCPGSQVEWLALSGAAPASGALGAENSL